MSDEKSKPVDDLKQGLGLLFKAAKGAVEKLPTDKIEDVVKDGAKEVGKAFESVANEIDKVFNKATGAPPPPEASAKPDEEEKKEPPAAPPAEAQPYDDAYAPEPPKGPRVG
ncbi:MAG: hypothetical protein KF819_06240 [Labilithrix sp.]|nr:hypothetical protein [Labilithrix sp.]